MRTLSCLTAAVLTVPFAFAHPPQDSDQVVPLEEEAPSLEQLVVLEGFVLESDGAPAEGAVVVTSAGGRALVDRNGRYRLETRVPIAAESLQITAVGTEGQNLAASRSVDLYSAAAIIEVPTFQLDLGTTCQPSWLPTFGGLPGTDGEVHALAVYDDGSGPALYAGGAFTSAGGVQVNRIARWDGSTWAALGSGINDLVLALTVFDDGGGPALFAGGRFNEAGDGLHRIAKWDGSTWASLGDGMRGNLNETIVEALTVFDDAAPEGLRFYRARQATAR